MQWYVIYTKPRREIKVHQLLQQRNIEAYCPTTTEVRQWSDRKKKVTEPLFKSYVFVRLEEKDRNKVFDVPGVVSYLFWLGRPAVVLQEEIQTLKDWLEGDEAEEIEVERFTPGEKLTITKGHFKDKEGVVAEVGKKRLRLVLEALGVVVNVKVSEVK